MVHHAHATKLIDERFKAELEYTGTTDRCVGLFDTESMPKVSHEQRSRAGKKAQVRSKTRVSLSFLLTITPVTLLD